jgi:hypothetical protein
MMDSSLELYVRPANNELLGLSFLARLRTANTHILSEDAALLFGSKAPTNGLLVKGLQDFCRRTYDLLGTAETLLNQNTHFHRVSVAYETLEQVEAFKLRVMSGAAGPSRGPRAPALFGEDALSCPSCPECDRENLKKYGFRVDLRFHVPYVNVCPIHDVPLHFPLDTLYAALCAGDPAFISKGDREYARRNYKCITTAWADSPFRKEQIRLKLRDNGWFSEKGHLHFQAAVNAFVEKFGAAHSDSRIRALLSSKEAVANALRNLLREDRTLEPVWCIYFQQFAEEVQYRNPIRPSRPAPIPRRNLLPTAEEVREAFHKGETVTGAAAILGIDITKAAALGRRYGVSFTKKPKTIDQAVRARVESMLSKGAAPAAIASEVGLSLTSVYRVLCANEYCSLVHKEQVNREHLERARTMWLSLCEKERLASASALRKLNPAAYTYLYRHDPAFLQQHKPETARFSRTAKRRPPHELVTLLQAAISAADSQCDRPGAVTRSSNYRRRQLTGLSEYALTKVVGSPPAESHGVFVKRRVRRTIEEKPELSKARVSALAREAKLRPSSLRKHGMPGSPKRDESDQ